MANQSELAALLADRARDIRGEARTDVVSPTTVDELCLIVEKLAEIVSVVANAAGAGTSQ